MSDTFNPECPNCKITIAGIEKWVDHIECTPKKYQRYDQLLAFVEALALDNTPKYMTIEYAHQWAKDLLKEIEK